MHKKTCIQEFTVIFDLYCHFHSSNAVSPILMCLCPRNANSGSWPQNHRGRTNTTLCSESVSSAYCPYKD